MKKVTSYTILKEQLADIYGIYDSLRKLDGMLIDSEAACGRLITAVMELSSGEYGINDEENRIEASTKYGDIHIKLIGGRAVTEMSREFKIAEEGIKNSFDKLRAPMKEFLKKHIMS